MMRCAKETEPIDITPPSLYTIWASGTPGGPLDGQAGFLAEEGKRLFFRKKETAEQKIRDLQNRCMNGSPAAAYECLVFPSEYPLDRSMAVEDIGSYDLCPGFDPHEYQIRSKDYGSTGGGCMVGTVSCFLPSLGRAVWVNCNDEGVTVASADYVWNNDHSGSWARYEDVMIFTAEFVNTTPEELGSWLPMVRDTLAYTAAQQTALGMEFQIPESWQDALEEQSQPPGPTMDAPC